MASQHHGKRHHDHHSNQRQHHSQSHQPPCLFFNQHGACRNGDATACSDGVHGRVTQVAVTELRLPLPTQVPPTASGPHSLIAQYESSRRAVAHFFIRQQTARDARVSRPLELGRAYWQDRLCVLPARLDCVAPKHGDSDSSAIEEKPDASSSSRADVPFSMTLLTVADVPVFARPALPVQLRQQEMRVTLNAPSLFPIVSALRSVSLFPPPPASDSKVCNFLSFRNNFNKIMNEPSWKMLVERVGRVIFLRQMQHPMCNFGLVGRQFEERCVAPSTARHSDSAPPPPLEFCTTVHACLGAHRLFLGAEIDMVDANSREYVEVKTTKPKTAVASSCNLASSDEHSSSDDAAAAAQHGTDAAHDVLSESEQQRIWVQCFLAGVDRLVVGVDQCPERGVLDVPDAACVLELGGASREGGALRRVTHEWKERRLKHARRVLDWVVQCCHQNALEERAVYWLEQKVVEPVASSSSAFASSSSFSTPVSSSTASASSTRLPYQCQDDATLALSLSRVDSRHAYVTDDVLDMF